MTAPLRALTGAGDKSCCPGHFTRHRSDRLMRDLANILSALALLLFPVFVMWLVLSAPVP